MQFANPIWLAGLGGILIPLAIHLLSRKEGKVIRIGSIRHFEETSTRQFKSIKLNEILLLILRSLLILLIVFLLAEFQWPGNAEGKTKWVLVEKGLDSNPELSNLINSLTEKGFEKRAFAKSFPLISDTINVSPENYWTLIESLSKQRLDSVVIISANRVNAFRGKRKTLPAHVSWISKPLPQREAVINQVKISADSVLVRRGSFTESETEFTSTITFGNTGAQSPDTVQVVIANSKAYTYDAKLLQASLNAINKYPQHHVAITSSEPSSIQAEKIEWLIWLTDEDAPNSYKNLMTINVHPSDNIIENNTPHRWTLTQRLTPENIIEENLTTQLAQLLFPEVQSRNKADQLDVRASDERTVGINTTSTGRVLSTSYSGHTLWIILIVLTFMAERIVSYKRMQ